MLLLLPTIQAMEKNTALFSILIPSWNNLAYLQLCIESIRLHSQYKHQIIVHLNEGTDGSLEWVREQNDLYYTHSSENIGICKALNNMARLAHTQYICYFNDDMYALPGWDVAMWNEIQQIGHNHFFLSSTMLEPFEKNNPAVISQQDYGQTYEEFEVEKLLNNFHIPQKKDWYGASWPPNVVSIQMWNAVGGYSEEFSPGLYSDPDFSMKLWEKGVRYFKGLSKSRVYHFGSKSLRRIQLNDGRTTFMQKWGISPGFFDKYFIKKGQEWKGAITNKPPTLPLLINKLSVRIRLLLK